MSAETRTRPEGEPVISEAALKKAEEFIEEEEGAHNRYTGVLAILMTAAAVAMSRSPWH